MWMTPAFFTASSIFCASGSVLASGFSQKTTFLFSAAATEIAMWLSPGVHTSTMSTSLRATTCSQLVACSCQPRVSAAWRTPSSCRPQTTFITGSKGVSKKRLTWRHALLWARPMNW